MLFVLLLVGLMVLYWRSLQRRREVESLARATDLEISALNLSYVNGLIDDEDFTRQVNALATSAAITRACR